MWLLIATDRGSLMHGSPDALHHALSETLMETEFQRFVESQRVYIYYPEDENYGLWYLKIV